MFELMLTMDLAAEDCKSRNFGPIVVVGTLVAWVVVVEIVVAVEYWVPSAVEKSSSFAGLSCSFRE